MKVELLIKNGKIPQGDRMVEASILVSNGKIVGFAQGDVDADQVIDVKGNLVLPGCIDSHTHFNDPGFTHRETFATGTQSAAAGGITMIVDMPCCSVPSVRSVAQLKQKLAALEPQAFVDYGMWGGATGEDVQNKDLHHIQEQADYGVLAFKVYMTPSVPTYPRVTDPELLEIFYEVAKTGLPVGIHGENNALCDFYVNKLREQGRMDSPAWAEARSILAEKVAVELGISFAEETGVRLHVVHMSIGIGAVIVGEAKKKGINVTAETCPHYLTLNAVDAMTEFGSFAKIAPPLRRKEDNEELWKALADGRVDFVATDHAPYEIPTEKAAAGMNIWTSFPGIPGVETMVPILVSEGYNKGRLTLSKLVDVLSRNAAIHYGLYPKKGALEIGSDADFTVIDLEKEWTIDKDKMHTMAKYTPQHGMKLKGKAVMTIVRGTLVYDDEKGIVGKPGYGQFVKRQQISQLDKIFKY
ncbi:MAG: allantoinase AllB [Clostridia bacterium]|nr:allantoinase AllB [Clostridia bacterium]